MVIAVAPSEFDCRQEFGASRGLQNLADDALRDLGTVSPCR